MSLLPKPYPDEIISSVVARASLHSGISISKLMSTTFGDNRSKTPLLISKEIHRLALFSGIEAEEVLLNHTIFPYSVAFMDPRTKDKLKAKFLGAHCADYCLGLPPIYNSNRHLFLRVCQDCVKEDIKRFGESYWRRSHILPGTFLCPTHGTVLRAEVALPRVNCFRNKFKLPHQVECKSIPINLAENIQMAISQLSWKALEGKICESRPLSNIYNERALSLGYRQPSGLVCTVTLAHILRDLFGPTLLNHMGCSLPEGRNSGWIGVLLAPLKRHCISTPMHILMQAFLEQKIPPCVIAHAMQRLQSSPSNHLMPDESKPSRFRIRAIRAKLAVEQFLIDKELRDIRQLSDFTRNDNLSSVKLTFARTK